MEKKIEKPIEQELKESYIDYAMSVIIGRALPNVKDGLKPVHRRVLFSMYELSLFHNKPFKKSARIVGDCLGKYHPHGDSAVYDALVRMSQPFSLRYPLINGQGNFGSIDGDSAAAMRYTEAKLSRIAEEMLEDLEKETVGFTNNFDESLKEPVVLPSKFPNLLVNGSSGIAVGMATSIPPHNLTEISKAIGFLIDNPNATINEITNIIKGPDFPTGAEIIGRKGILDYLHTGKGKAVIRSKIDLDDKGSKRKLIITEIPYMVNKTTLIEGIADQVKREVIRGISSIKDESNKEGIRIVLELKNDAKEQLVMNQLYKHTMLQTSMGIQLLVLDGQKPVVVNIKQMIEKFIEHRCEIIEKRTQFELSKAQSRIHILKGLIIALKHIDEVIKTIKASDNAEMAKASLISEYSLSEIQAGAILDMKLQRLTRLETEKIESEISELEKKVKEYKEILASRSKVLGIVKEETEEIEKKYGDKRRTAIFDGGIEEIEEEDLIEDKPWAVIISEDNYIKRTSLENYRLQRRGGRGLVGAKINEEDIVKDIFVASSKDYLLVFTSKGTVNWLKTYMVPESSRTSKGRPIASMIDIGKDEKISAVMPLRNLDDDFLIFSTKKGTVKKTATKYYSNPRKKGIIAIKLDNQDELISVKNCRHDSDIMIFTKKGVAVHFISKDVRAMGRNSAGVRGIRLEEGDHVISMAVCSPEEQIVTISSKGYGKRTEVSKYRLTRRGGKGVRNILLTEKNGDAVDCLNVIGDEEILVITAKGIIIRTNASDIPIYGRSSQGVRIIRLDEHDEVASFSKILD